MQQHDLEVIQEIAQAVRDDRADEVRRLMTQYPRCLRFLDFRDCVTDADIDSWADYAAHHHGPNELWSMLMFDFRDPVRVGIYESATSGNLEELKRLIAEHPRYLERDRDSMLVSAVHEGQIEVVDALLGMGAYINCMPRKATTPLSVAVGFSAPKMVQHLLERGADPNFERPIIGAINREPEELGLELVRLLVEHGADVNKVFLWFDDPDMTFTPLEWSEMKEKRAIAAYLRSKGAVEREKKGPAKAAPENLADEVVAYFEEHVGAPRPEAQIEIVPTEPPICIHVIPAANNRSYVTLFTTGMSEHAMNVPDGTDDYRFAELYMQLPANWPIDGKWLSKPKNAWPTEWLRSTAKYPHQHETWLGGPVTIIANGDPPQPLAKGVKFTSLLLMADREFTSLDGRQIYLYRLTPLYSEERELEIKHGIGALMRAFDENEIPTIVDLDRPNVGKGAQ